MTDCWGEWDDVQEIEGVPAEGYAPFNFPVEGAYLPFFFTNESFTRVLSALWNGAILTYGNEGFQVIWDFLVNVEYPMSFCSQLIECITSDEDVKTAFRNFIMTDPAIAEYMRNIASIEALSVQNRGQNLLKPEQCDPDYIFNQVSVTVLLLHDLTEDLFEAIEVGTNALERMTILSSGVPVWGQIIPADELLAFADQLVEEVAEDYSGAYDEALYDTIRCKIFCAVKDDCTLSLERLIELYLELLGEAIPDDPIEALVAIVGYLNVGDFGTDAPVYAMHLLVLYLIQLQQEVLGVDFTQLFLRITAAGDDANNDWEILCEDCAGPVEPTVVLVSNFTFTTAPTYTFVEKTIEGYDVWDVQLRTAPNTQVFLSAARDGGGCYELVDYVNTDGITLTADVGVLCAGGTADWVPVTTPVSVSYGVIVGDSSDSGKFVRLTVREP